MDGLRALRPGDPAEVGGHTLLGRLGAGGMGVVYLGRSPGGALVALKVIRAEHAADPDFRVRFRREAEATGQLTSRWLVPVTAADPESREPWLATAFVPGPSLAEAVDGHGALPERAVRVLGARLAEALTEVHAAGLVHRDIKPGNILLALDGPRVIDFGIVRPEGVTALTASDLVIGSPGFLSPEQAQARSGEVGPPSDVFSLGCVLAYAVTGRRPFGVGTVAGVLYRTVHEEPDLEGAPPALLPLLRACLARDPRSRPTAASVREALADQPPRDPRTTDHWATDRWATDDRTTDELTTDDWLPVPLPGIIAERSAAVLALPDPPPPPSPYPTAPEPTTVAASSSGTGRPSRRMVLGLGAAAAVTAGGAFAAVSMARGGDKDDGGGGDGPLPQYTIGVQTDLSGELRAAGRAQKRGAQLAVAHFNADEGRPFDLKLAVRDDRGEAARAEKVAAAFIEDREVVAVLGPTGDAGLKAVIGRHNKAQLPLVSVSTAAPGVHSGGTPGQNAAFFQLRANANAADGFVEYLTSGQPSEHTALVDDRAATGDEDWGLAERIEQYPPAGGSTTTHAVPAGSDDFGPAAEAVRASGAQAVIFIGASPQRAALCARALDQAGFEGTRMAPEPVLRPELPADGGKARLPFLEEAGTAAEGWVCVTTYADATRLPKAEGFAAEYRERFPEPPGLGPTAPFAVEAYDALLLVASALRRPDDGGPERGSTTSRLRSSEHEGLAKRLSFDPETGGFNSDPGIFLYRVEEGSAVSLGRLEEI